VLNDLGAKVDLSEALAQAHAALGQA